MRSNRFTGTSAEASERIDHLKKSIEDGLIVWFEGVEKTECGNERCVDSVLASSLGALLGYSQGLWQFTKAAKAGGHGGSTELQSFENNLRTIRERIDRIALELFVAIPETVRSTDVRLSSLKADSQSLFQLVAQSAVLLKNDEEKLQQMLATEDADLEAARRDRQTRNADAERSVLDARQGVQHAEQAQASRQDLTSTVYSVWKWAVGIAIAWQTTKQGSLFNAIIPFLVWLGVAWLSRRPALPFVSAIIAGLRGSATPAQALARLGAVEAEAVLARASLNKDDAVAVQRRDANKKMLRQVFEKSRETLFAKIDGAVTHTQVGAQSLQRDIALAASGELSAKQSRARVELRRRVDQARVDLKQLRKVLGLDANKNENGPRIFREMSRQAMIVGESIAILPAEVAKVWGNQTISVPRVIRPELPCLVVGSMASREPGSSEKLASAILFGVLKATPPSELVITIFHAYPVDTQGHYR